MARPPRHTLSTTSAAHPCGLPRHAPRRAAAAFFLTTLVALPFAVLYRAAVSESLQDSWRWDTLPSLVASEDDGAEGDDLDSEDLKLERVLQKASMGDNTVILTTLNAAWASPGSVLNLFMDSFRSGVRTSSLLKHLVIIAFDWTAYKQCVKIHPYCFALGTEGVDFSEEKRFLTSGYLEMMWKRLDFLRLVLEKGYSFVFSCPNGHTICSNCKHRVENHCPNCRQELGNIRCLALEKVAESLQLPCKFQSLGCTEIHPYQNKLKHEDLCRFRPYNCPYAGSECLITGDVPDQ